MMAGVTLGLEAWLWMGAWAFVLLVLVSLLVRDPDRAHREDEMHALRSRLARGEIAPDEFERVRGQIES